LQTPKTKVLIDAGLSGLKTRRLLTALGHDIENIEAVFITHEHQDHIAGILGLSKYPHIQFFANQDTANAIERKFKRPIRWSLFHTGDEFYFKDLKIKTVSIPHDAYDPVGYVIHHQKDTNASASLAWVTDLGHIPLAIKQAVLEVDLLILESNYDDDMLDQDTKRPWSLKQRIRGRHGHLSNKEAHAFIQGQTLAKWRHIALVHLSRDCNDKDRLQALFDQENHTKNPYTLSIFDPLGGPSPIFDLTA
jgi:phosphoribosyl 1,2-cyclic phosphodiesterase